MQLQTQIVGLTEDIRVTVHEADGSFDSRLIAKENEAEKLADEDKTFLFFAKNIYPILYACTRGEPVPDAKTAYALPGEKLDEWYMAVWSLNPELITLAIKEPEQEQVEFRDGNKLIVYESLDRPSFMLRLHRLEQEAEDHPPADPDEFSFRVMLYPKLAACSIGIVPSADQACQYPRIELAKWSDVVMKLNRRWFAPILKAADEMAARKEQVKKKRRSRPADRPPQSVLPG